MRSAAIIGAGEIGSGWAVLFAAHRVDVRIYDPDPHTATRIDHAIADAAHAGLRADRDRLHVAPDVAQAVRDAEWVQESVPERLALKQEVLGAIGVGLAPRAVVASSTSACTVAELAASLAYAERFLIVHPLHPVYAVPVVEVSAGAATAAATVERASEVMRTLGRTPVTVRGDVRGLASNRLTAALMREALALVAQGALSAADVDRVIREGIATGWMAEGVFGTEAVATGDADADAPVQRVRRQLEPVLASLAAWSTLDRAHEHALAEAFATRSADAARRRWTETIVRLLDAVR